MNETDKAIERGLERLEQIEIQMNATGNASPSAIGDVRNALQIALNRMKAQEVDEFEIGWYAAIDHIRKKLEG